jgi:pyruvate dehydrogenase E2 component (dihydrolipoamide acetyltransferase)
MTVDDGATPDAPIPPVTPESAQVPQIIATAEITTSAANSTPTASTMERRIRCSPAARRLAADNGVDIRLVAGSGPNGRIQMADIARAAQSAKASVAGLTPMRRAVARAMTQSAMNIPQFSLDSTADLSAIQADRPRHDAPKPSVTDYLIMAIGRTLPRFPAVNALFVGQPEDADARIDQVRGIHVSLVVAVPDGLQLVTVHGVEQCSLAEVTRLRVAAVARARDGRLSRDDVATGNIGLSNLGPNGPERFNAMLSPSQSAILAIGRERETLVVRDGAMAIRKVMTITLTVDHRVIDGKLAAEFLAALIDCLESDWSRI